nr:lysine histidine transporter-like 8 [Ipomoea batatas]
MLYQTLCGAACTSKPLTNVEWYLVFTCAAVLLSQLPNLNSIAGVSLLAALTAIAYCTLIWAVSVARGSLPNVSYDRLRNGKQIARIFDVLNALGIIAFAFRGHNHVLEIQVKKPKTYGPMWWMNWALGLMGMLLSVLLIAAGLYVVIDTGVTSPNSNHLYSALRRSLRLCLSALSYATDDRRQSSTRRRPADSPLRGSAFGLHPPPPLRLHHRSPRCRRRTDLIAGLVSFAAELQPQPTPFTAPPTNRSSLPSPLAAARALATGRLAAAPHRPRRRSARPGVVMQEDKQMVVGTERGEQKLGKIFIKEELCKEHQVQKEQNQCRNAIHKENKIDQPSLFALPVAMIIRKELFFYAHDNYNQLVKIAKNLGNIKEILELKGRTMLFKISAKKEHYVRRNIPFPVVKIKTDQLLLQQLCPDLLALDENDFNSDGQISEGDDKFLEVVSLFLN